MAVDLIFAPEAGRDVAEAYGGYEAARAGLGEDFPTCVEACLHCLRRMPQMHPIVHENYRRAMVRRFPYGVFYEWAGETVTVYAVFHASQDPEKWQRRLP